MDLNTLKKRANQAELVDNERQKKRKRQLYRYARQKGFTATEARILSGYTKEKIDQLAQERDSQ